ncbi:MAG: thioredoxin fold domain-containing protein [Bdellovibrionales bacterium]|nr:thioredoxin fold domain-containing protein [Bdellovibrionales bacterium]
MKLSSKTFRHIPMWAQLAVGLVVAGLIVGTYLFAPIYVSEWYEENLSFYENGTTALQSQGITPSAPTILLFWENSCEICKRTMQDLKDNHRQLRVIGVHPYESGASEVEIRKTWQALAPQPSRLVIDESRMLFETFEVKGVPHSVLILPRTKKMYSLLGEISRSRPKLSNLIKN